MSEQEFLAAKAALMQIIQGSNQSPKIVLRATEDLLALIERYEASRWTLN